MLHSYCYERYYLYPEIHVELMKVLIPFVHWHGNSFQHLLCDLVVNMDAAL